ncbi:MAG: TlyA family RNA methyltransferase [Epsilonproteobacteria bacterium]|nr:TlyA family RNA methyltransferase [Campylobacterota bacterium]
MRLDRRLVAEGLAQSRTRAQALIKEGKVLVEGRVVRKSAFEVEPHTPVTLSEADRYVGRAAKKLEGLLKSYPVAIEGKRCLDVGASTGGFTQVLLEKGALSVTALDVGRGQLHPSLKSDGRVISLENTDIRAFESETPFEVVTCDVSFISLRKILPALDRLCDGVAILLFKPQFEAGPEARRNSRGVVVEDEAVTAAMRAFEAEASALGWRLMVRAPSVLPGKEGNREWFYVYRCG